MSRTYYIQAVIENNRDHINKCKAYRACEAANIDIPYELEIYFEGNEPNEDGMVEDIFFEEVFEDNKAGFQIKTIDIPENAKYIRFMMA